LEVVGANLSHRNPNLLQPNLEHTQVRSPITNEVLEHERVAPNHSMRSLILQALEDQLRLDQMGSD
jgi:hypothetical protein